MPPETEKDMKANESLGRWISFLYRQFMIYINDELASYDLGPGQFYVLHVLHHNNGLSQQDISDILHLDKATTGRAIKKLEADEYVERIRGERDKRVYHVYLTDKARQMEPIIHEILRRWTQILSTDFTPTEKEHVMTFLKRMHQNVLDYKKD